MISLEKLRMPWMADAACRGYRTSLWFPLEHDPDGNLLVEPIVMERCAVCPVAIDCLNYALHHDVDGIWAGTTPQARKAWRRTNRVRPERLQHPDHQPPTTEEPEAS